MKYYSIIPVAAFARLQNAYQIITQLLNKDGSLSGWLLLEGYHSPEQMAEITGLGGQNLTYEQFLEWQAEQNK